MGDSSGAKVDDEVKYSYDVSNNGTTTMSNITISDNMVRTFHDKAARVCVRACSNVRAFARARAQRFP